MAKKKILYEVPELTGNTHVHFTNGNVKMGNGIWHSSFLPGEKPIKLKDGNTLIDMTGSCTGCCDDCEKICYARNYVRFHHNSTVESYAENQIIAANDPERYMYELQNLFDNGLIPGYRQNVSGEHPTFDFLYELNKLAKKNPYTMIYFYTKRYEWIEKLDTTKADNLGVSASIYHNNYDNPCGYHEFIIDDGTDPEVAKLPHCPAVDKYGRETGVTCAKCKRCLFAKRGTKTAVYIHI